MLTNNFPAERSDQDEEILVYRYLESHDVPFIGERAQRWLLGIGAVALVAYGVWVVRTLLPLSGHGNDAGGLVWLFLKAAVVVFLLVGRRFWNRHLRLHISAQGLRQEHVLPLGLHSLFGHNWSLSWSEITGISTRTSQVPTNALKPLAFAEIVVRTRKGSPRVLRPAFWFRLDDPPRPRLRAIPSTTSPFEYRSSDPWAHAENQPQLARAFADLRLVHAIRHFCPAPGFELSWPGTRPGHGAQLDRQPEVLALLGGAMLVFVTGFGLMTFEPTLHLHTSPTWTARAMWAVGSLMLWSMALMWWRAKRNDIAASLSGPNARKVLEPLSKTALVLASVLWMASVAFALEPLLAHAARLGVSGHAQTYRFTVSGGWARASGQGAAMVPPIQLPGSQSRLAWIKNGSEVELTTVEGPFGLWIYDDIPLRNLATAQGVR